MNGGAQRVPAASLSHWFEAKDDGKRRRLAGPMQLPIYLTIYVALYLSYVFLALDSLVVEMSRRPLL